MLKAYVGSGNRKEIRGKEEEEVLTMANGSRTGKIVQNSFSQSCSIIFDSKSHDFPSCARAMISPLSMHLLKLCEKLIPNTC